MATAWHERKPMNKQEKRMRLFVGILYHCQSPAMQHRFAVWCAMRAIKLVGIVDPRVVKPLKDKDIWLRKRVEHVQCPLDHRFGYYDLPTNDLELPDQTERTVEAAYYAMIAVREALGLYAESSAREASRRCRQTVMMMTLFRPGGNGDTDEWLHAQAVELDMQIKKLRRMIREGLDRGTKIRKERVCKTCRHYRKTCHDGTRANDTCASWDRKRINKECSK